MCRVIIDYKCKTHTQQLKGNNGSQVWIHALIRYDDKTETSGPRQKCSHCFYINDTSISCRGFVLFKCFVVLSDTLDGTIPYKLHIYPWHHPVCSDMCRLFQKSLSLLPSSFLSSSHQKTILSGKGLQQRFSHVSLRKQVAHPQHMELHKIPMRTDHSYFHSSIIDIDKTC